MTIVVSAVVLLCWVPLRQRPGFGTVANVLVIGVLVDPFLALLGRLPDPLPLPAAIGLVAGGIVLNGLASGLYIGARLGPGPRDGLMTGLVARTGWSVRLVRSGIEVLVVTAGWLLGGTVGLGDARLRARDRPARAPVPRPALPAGAPDPGPDRRQRGPGALFAVCAGSRTTSPSTSSIRVSSSGGIDDAGRLDVLRDLLRARGADERGGDVVVLQHPRDRELRHDRPSSSAIGRRSCTRRSTSSRRGSARSCRAALLVRRRASPRAAAGPAGTCR